MRIKEHKDACNKGAVAEHAWTNQHPILWDETTVIDQARRQTEIFLKKVVHIHLTPEDEHFNQDKGTDLPGCWIPTLCAFNMKPH